jgi:hypothetical protein
LSTSYLIDQAIRRQVDRIETIQDTLKQIPGELHKAKFSEAKICSANLYEYLNKTYAKGQPPVITACLMDRIKLMASVFTSNGDILEDALPDGGSLSSNCGNLSNYSERTLVPSSKYVLSALSLIAEKDTLEQGLTFVGEDIFDLIQIACSSLEPEALNSSDLIAPEGFCFLEKPLIVSDRHPETGVLTEDLRMAIRAFSWSGKPDTNAVEFTLYSDTELLNTVYIPSLIEVVGEDMLSVGGGLRGRGAHELIAVDITSWSFNREWSDNIHDSVLKDVTVVDNVVSTFRKFFLVLMRFCWQELLVPERFSPPRPTLRSMVRKLNQPIDVNVVRLRRVRSVASGYHDGVGHRLDYRLLVRGHWRNQHYRSLGPAKVEGQYNSSSHRRIWIDPHVKGPDDAPFIVKDKVTALVR